MFSSLLFTAAVITTNKSYAATHPYYGLQACNCHECMIGSMQGIEKKRLCSRCTGHVTDMNIYDYDDRTNNAISVLGGPCPKNCGNTEGTPKPVQMDGAQQPYGRGYSR